MVLDIAIIVLAAVLIASVIGNLLFIYRLFRGESATTHLLATEQLFDKKLQQSDFQVANTVSPVADALRQLDGKVSQIEKDRVAYFSVIKEQIFMLSEAAKQLKTETHTLSTALKHPSSKGKWGELQLRRVLEMSGMLSYCDFQIQPNINDQQGRAIRPDVIVRLPADRFVAIDAKVPLNAYLNAVSSSDGSGQDKLLDHANALKNHIRDLAKKEYFRDLQGLDFVVLFLPGESIYAAALDVQPDLIDYAWRNRVIVATPTTLIALLRTIASGWSNKALEDNAKEIAGLGKELYERLCTFNDRLTSLGNNITKSVESYNDMIGTLESRVLPSARRIKEYGIASSKELPTINTVNHAVRKVSSK